MTNAPNNPRITPALNPPTTRNTSIVDDLPTRSIDLSAPQYRSDGDLINIAGYPPRQSDEIFLSLLTQAFNDNPRLVKKLGPLSLTSTPPHPCLIENTNLHHHAQATIPPSPPPHPRDSSSSTFPK
ncbi:hypothetical protein JADG_006454 [Aureobasidium aubasidani]|nr:hypothetical protein JADG_006454 [Aureobasidium pullulans]